MIIVSKELKAVLLERQNHRCCWCGYRFEGADDEWRRPTFEHVLPKSRGGDFDDENIVIACKGCNSARGNMPVDAFIAIFDAMRVDRRGSVVGNIMNGLFRWHTSRLGENAWARIRNSFTSACRSLREMKRSVPEFEAWLLAYSAVVNCGQGHDHEDPFNNPAEDLRNAPAMIPDYQRKVATAPAVGMLMVPCAYCGRPFGLTANQIANGVRHIGCKPCRKTWSGFEGEVVKGVPFLTGRTDKEARLELDRLMTWLQISFKAKVVDDIKEQYAGYRKQAIDDGEGAKNWLEFLRDFRESYEELLAQEREAA